MSTVQRSMFDMDSEFLGIEDEGATRLKPRHVQRPKFQILLLARHELTPTANVVSARHSVTWCIRYDTIEVRQGAPALCRRCQRARKSECGVGARTGELRTSTLPVHPALFAAWAAPLAQCPRRPNVSGSAPCCLGHSVAHREPSAAHPRKRKYRCAGSRCYHGCE